MSFENELKATLAQHATDPTPRPDDAWRSIATDVRRSRRRTIGVMTAVVGLLAIGAGTLALTDAGKDAAPNFAIEPSSQPTPTCEEQNACASATPFPSLTKVYRDDTEGWQIRYPDGWQVSRFEGHTGFRPAGVGSAESGENTYTVEVWLESGATLPSAAFDLQEGNWSEDKLAVRKAMTTSSKNPAGGVTTYWSVDWGNEFCSESRCPVPAEGVLHVTAFSSNGTLEDQFGSVGTDMIASLATGSARPFPDAPVTTRGGTIDVAYDASTVELGRFLDARTAGGGAERFAVGAAATAYQQHTGGLDLYVNSETKNAWISYEVVARSDCGGSCATFQVRISDGADGLVERITVKQLENGTILITEVVADGRFP